jgi:hypothetical protein
MLLLLYCTLQYYEAESEDMDGEDIDGEVTLRLLKLSHHIMIIMCDDDQNVHTKDLICSAFALRLI